ncbi:MAG: hypothetical protein KR126chlam6_00507 [Candidatus Anoxychlamydiales bacterium]|nr:hypothetical protein [Candidatus Anoxychlamydiales bacterium]
MVFLVDIAFAIELIALVLGGTLLYFLKAHKVQFAFGKVIAYFVIVVALITMLCSSYYGTKYWVQGYYETPMGQKHAMFKKYKKHMKDYRTDKRHKKAENY